MSSGAKETVENKYGNYYHPNCGGQKGMQLAKPRLGTLTLIKTLIRRRDWFPLGLERGPDPGGLEKTA